MKYKRRDVFLDILILIVIAVFVFYGKKLNLNDTVLLKLTFLFITVNTLFLFLFDGIYFNIKGINFSFKQDFGSISKSIFISACVLLFIFILNINWRNPQYLQKLFMFESFLWISLVFLRFMEFAFIHNRKKILVIIYARKAILKSIYDDINSCIDKRWVLLSFSEDNRFMSLSRFNQDDIERIQKEEFDNNICFDVERIKKIITRKEFLPVVVIDQYMQNREAVINLIPWCFSNSISVTNLFSFYEELCKKIALFYINDDWIWDFHYFSQTKLTLFRKRLFDIFVAILLTPFAILLSVFISLAIKIESRGPVLFRQERKGARERIFKAFKFRTMIPHEDDSAQWPHIEKDLITRLGKFLRWTGLDEIPQLINIYKGEMSFVGARPARTQVASEHEKRIPFFAISHSMPPGISGWAQIHQGTDSGYDTILERVKYNLYYVKHYSIFLDIYIFLKSIKLFFSFKKPPPTQSKVSEKMD